MTALLAAALVACGGAWAGTTQKAGASQPAAPASPLAKLDRSHAGQAAPGVMLEAKGGTKRGLKAFAGKPLLVNLWATWCAPCVAEMPEIDRVAAAGKGRLTVVPVSQDLEGWRAVDRFFRPGRFPALTPLLDQPNDLALALGAKGLPMTVFYDAKGKEVWRVNGPLKWDDPAVRRALGL